MGAAPSEQPLRLRPIPPAPGENGAVAKHDAGIAVEPGLDLANRVQPHDLGSAETEEAGGVEPVLDLAEGTAAAVLSVAGCKAQIVAVGADDVDLVHGEQHLAILSGIRFS